MNSWDLIQWEVTRIKGFAGKDGAARFGAGTPTPRPQGGVNWARPGARPFVRS